MERPLSMLCKHRIYIFFRSFHFHMERPLAFLLIIMSLPYKGETYYISSGYYFSSATFLKTTAYGKLTTYPNDIWYQQSVKQKLFHIEGTILNAIPLQNYSPFYEKPCYHLNSETVTDTRKPKGGKCSGTYSGHSLCLGRKDSTSPSRGITQSKSEHKPVSVKTQKR